MSATGHGTPAMYRAELRLDGNTCAACRAAHCAANRASAAKNPRKRPSTGRPVGRPVGASAHRDEVLTEWEFWRNYISFRQFPSKVGMSSRAWQLMFQRAQDAGDPRAVRGQSSSRRAA